MKTFLSIILCLVLVVSAEAAKPKKPAAKGANPAFKKLDKNNDGKLSKKEFEAGKGKNFAKLDKDNNGSLSAKEFGGKK